MKSKRFLITLVFTISTLFIFFNSHLAEAVWYKKTVDSDGIVGWNTSLALDNSNNPHISYYDHTNGDLKYAYYYGSWHAETVDSEGDVGGAPRSPLTALINPILVILMPSKIISNTPTMTTAGTQKRLTAASRGLTPP